MCHIGLLNKAITVSTCNKIFPGNVTGAAQGQLSGGTASLKKEGYISRNAISQVDQRVHVTRQNK